MKKTIPIRYIGKKIEETDHLYGTGITWFGYGDVQPVPKYEAAFLLFHTDIFADDRNKADQAKDPIIPGRPKAPYRDIDNELPTANLVYMTKEAMAQYHERNFRERIDPKTMTAQQMRNTIIDKMRTHI
jgi:hypothetical protein